MNSVRVSQDELKRVAKANADLVDAARGLVALVDRTNDPALSAQLRQDIGKILASSEVIGSAVKTATLVTE